MNIDKNINFSLLIYAFAVMLGASYLFAFWRPIGFNIFPFLSIKDFLTSPFDRVIMILFPPVISVAFVYVDMTRKTKDYMFCLMLFLLSIGFLRDLFNGWMVFHDTEFFYRNEISLLTFILTTFCSGVILLFVSFKVERSIYNKIISFALIQLSTVMMAGYTDGKSIFTGADRAYFLENKELCDKTDQRDWVYLSQYSELSFFMNTIDKRICIIKDSNYTLMPRYYSLFYGHAG